MYVCTYQQIQDMMSLQCDCTLVTHQEECDCPILYYKENNNDVCTVSICVHVQLRNIVSLHVHVSYCTIYIFHMLPFTTCVLHLTCSRTLLLQ